jgi:hypothetical protein
MGTAALAKEAVTELLLKSVLILPLKVVPPWYINNLIGKKPDELNAPQPQPLIKKLIAPIETVVEAGEEVLVIVIKVPAGMAELVLFSHARISWVLQVPLCVVAFNVLNPASENLITVPTVKSTKETN